jgi:Arc/MetJ-type ribon-helix-helix transcriptional regulator
MARLTVSLNDETEEIVEEKVGDNGEYESKSEFVRDCIQAHTRVEDLEKTIERLEREKQMILQERDEKKELARYVEDQRTRQEKKDTAPIWTRAKWRILGMPAD